MSTDQDWDGTERRKGYRIWQDKIEKRLDAGDTTMKELRTELAANTATTSSIKSSTQELVELLHSVKGAFTVLEMIGKLAKPLAFMTTLVVAVGALISSFKSGGHP